jgi:Xaa-Pro aminopeptidase
MKKNLDGLMRKMKIDAIYAEGDSSRDANMFYLLNGANIYAQYIKKRGKPAVVIHTPIEREVAERTGHRLININQYDRRRIQEKYRDRYKANAHFLNMVFNDLKVIGRVVFYGNFPLGDGYNYIDQIRRVNRKIRIHKDANKNPVAQARMTKDADEISRIRKVRNGVIHAFDTALESVQACRVRGDGFLCDGKRRLLIGDLKQIIRRELFARGIIDSAGLIVAQGRDAGVPHNSGRDRQPVKIGKPIVFDIFPQEIGGGYFFDFTRTVCFGHASKQLRELYHTVERACDYAFGLLKVGRAFRDIEHKICKFFEKENHKTFLTDSKNQIGYCHSLGHGIGLNIHESPSFNLLKTNTGRIRPGMVFTIEPGLYYPAKGHGVRIEDVIYIDQNGRAVNMTNYPRRLVVGV